MKRAASIFSLCFLLLLAVIITYTRPHAKPVIKKTELLLGTVVDISISGYDEASVASKAAEAAFREIERVESVFSAYKEGSAITQINSLHEGDPITVDDEVIYVMRRAMDMSKRLDGAFDVTISPLRRLWVSRTSENRLPTQEELDAALFLIGFKYVSIDPEKKEITLKKEGVKIDLGGIAKGYAVERAIAVLKRYGIRNAIVNAGGDLYCLGRKSSRTRWKVGIRDPLKKDRLLGELSVENEAVSTSGGYERYSVVNNVRYSHIIDPRTGFPVTSNPISVTVVAGDAILSDAFATGISVLGLERGIEAIRTSEDVEAIIVTEEGGKLRTYISDGLKSRYEA